ncbi:hypothetical protein B0H17DRAFT_1053090 [Mycena rosella]|uniref:Uncharacterized protein n=1 Tax=Mycena rosella TaxID=1033263 RepID=A0AAD7DRV7_MYCRO|nr:hypothetical protein B0H17DRAFT_1053090 [Mycena rosella]
MVLPHHPARSAPSRLGSVANNDGSWIHTDSKTPGGPLSPLGCIRAITARIAPLAVLPTIMIKTGLSFTTGDRLNGRI